MAAKSTPRSLLLFVHGLGGSAADTWRQFPELVRSDPELKHVEVAFYEYPSQRRALRPFRRLPTIQLLAGGLNTEIEHLYSNYDEIVIVAHSLGGLIARRYIVDCLLGMPEQEDHVGALLRVHKCLFYAVPNDGAGLAAVGKYASWRQPQVKQLCRSSDFLEALNREWDTLGIGKRLDIKYVVAAQDGVVNEKSARGLDGVRKSVAVLPNSNHRECVKPTSVQDVRYKIMKNFVLDNPKTKPGLSRKSKQLRVVGFDLDGTLLRGLTFSWTEVWKSLGYPDDVRGQGMKSFLNQEWTYQEWCSWAVAKFRARGLTREHLVALAERISVTKNLEPALATLRDAGYRLALISGGIDTLLYAKIPNADELFDDIYINKLTFDDDGLVEDVEATSYDFQGKVKALELTARRAGCDVGNAVFVGDEFNDMYVASCAALTIAYPPKGGATPMANLHIEQDDLNLVAEAILNAR